MTELVFVKNGHFKYKQVTVHLVKLTGHSGCPVHSDVHWMCSMMLNLEEKLGSVFQDSAQSAAL